MIELNNVTLSYGSQDILNKQNMIVNHGERVAIMGPSGCGKTSFLRLIAGLTRPNSGSILVHTNRISYLFQEPRLLPWISAEENINTVLSDRASTLPDARRWLEAVGLSNAVKKYPHELSGGMQQRVSLARALAYNGDIFLLDEPLKGLDAKTKADMLLLIRQRTEGKTLLLATHDFQEAEALTDVQYSYQNHNFTRK